MKKIFSLLSIVTLCACSHPAANPIALNPIGDEPMQPAIITAYEEGFDHEREDDVPIGAEIIEVDGKLTGSIGDVAKLFYASIKSKNPLRQVKLKTSHGDTIVSANELYDPIRTTPKISLFDDDKSYVLSKKITGIEYPILARRTDKYLVEQEVVYWPTQPPLIEVVGAYKAREECKKKCSLDNLIVRDNITHSSLRATRLDYAAYAVYPDIGAPGQAVAVPPPTLVGYNSFSNTAGNIYGNSYGNNFYGNYSGVTTTTTTPVYDYSAQNAAAMANLGIAIRNASIEKQNNARIAFFQSRIGNLKAGKMIPDETRLGSLFFVAPPVNVDGFDVTTVLGGEEITSSFMLPAK